MANLQQSSEEIWLPVKGYEGLYEVSNMGRMRSLDREVNGHLFCVKKSKVSGKIRSSSTPSKCHQYIQVSLTKNGIPRVFLLHRLIAIAFIPNPENKKEVNHIDAVRHNNHVSNLEWVTRRENANHATRIGRVRNGERCTQSKLTESGVLEIRKRKGEMLTTLANEFGVSPSSVCDIQKFRTWKNLA